MSDTSATPCGSIAGTRPAGRMAACRARASAAARRARDRPRPGLPRGQPRSSAGRGRPRRQLPRHHQLGRCRRPPTRPPASCLSAGFAFRIEDSGHPRLVELRTRFHIERVAGEGTDLERANRIRVWIKSIWAHELPSRQPVYDGLLIIDRAARGVESFICMHYSVALVHCCLSVGIQARLINIHRGIAAEAYTHRRRGLGRPARRRARDGGGLVARAGTLGDGRHRLRLHVRTGRSSR